MAYEIPRDVRDQLEEEEASSDEARRQEGNDISGEGGSIEGEEDGSEAGLAIRRSVCDRS